MISNLYTKENYLIQDKYVSGKIVEYDVRQANINILFKTGIIDQSYYNFLSNIPKHDREVEVGKLHLKLLSQGIDVSKTISIELEKYRKLFFENNQIQDQEVVRISKDAITILKSYDLTYLDYDGIVFVPKLVASAMLNLNKILVFSKYNNLDQIEIEVKGLGDKDVLHQNGMLSLIANTMYLIDRVSIQDAILYIQDMYKQYINRELPIDYYRDFNSYSTFTIGDKNIHPMFIGEEYKNIINISYNLNYIRELYAIVFNLYTTHNRL